MKRATISDAPAMLNTNDRAMWVLGFNAALEAPFNSPPKRGVEVLRNAIALLREEACYRDDEGEDTDALDDLLAWLAPHGVPAAPIGHVGESQFEGWFARYNPACKGDKQRARDAYAAGLGEQAAHLAGVAPSDAPRDGFNGDTPHLINCMRALVNLNDAGALTPHGIGGHARALLLAAAVRLERAAGVPVVPPAKPDPKNCTATVGINGGVVTTKSCTTGRPLIDRGESFDCTCDYFECPDCGKRITAEYGA